MQAGVFLTLTIYCDVHNRRQVNIIKLQVSLSAVLRSRKFMNESIKLK
jgi:hypothetical protein